MSYRKIRRFWPWEKSTYPEPPPREILRQQLAARKGGVIGTGGLGAVALRFDDAPFAFRHKVLPLIVERGLPYTRVTTSSKIHKGIIKEKEFPLMEKHAIRYGGEIWNHGATHNDASGRKDIYRELVASLYQLRELMPRIPIDCFAPPGGTNVSYDGFLPSYTAQSWATEAGRLVLAHHSLASGYLKDTYYRGLTGTPVDGQVHYSLDTYTLERAHDLLDRVALWKAGTVLMWHSNKLDSPGCMSMDVFEQVLDYIVSLRDQGKLVVLTCSGLSFADRSSRYRDNILTADCGNPLNELITHAAFRSNIPGSTRELVSDIEAPPGNEVVSTIGESKRKHTVPEGGRLRIRHVATIPMDIKNLRVSIDAKSSQVSLNAV